MDALYVRTVFSVDSYQKWLDAVQQNLRPMSSSVLVGSSMELVGEGKSYGLVTGLGSTTSNLIM